jgi:osmotically-inducible protein OsmY
VNTRKADDPQNVAERAASATKDAAVKVADTTAGAAVAVAGATRDASVATAETVTDAWITTHLAAKFVDEPTLKDSNINVDTDDHVVTLRGDVKTAAAKARAAAIATDTQGVSRVINQIAVKP